MGRRKRKRYNPLVRDFNLAGSEQHTHKKNDFKYLPLYK